MIAPETLQTQVLLETSARQKVASLHSCLHELLSGRAAQVPETPGRDVQIVAISALPPKKGLSSREGQARLLHDLASIELQAMELGVRTLVEYPSAPREFREQLAEVTLDEGRHLGLCLDALDALEMPWGTFPAHIGLWQCVRATDSLIDRVLIVHRYLEGSGLDASDTLLRRLRGVKAAVATGAVEVIRRDEVGHVQFGSRWYRRLCTDAGLDAGDDFGARLMSLAERIPRRLEPVREDLRFEAGFDARELAAIGELQARWR